MNLNLKFGITFYAHVMFLSELIKRKDVKKRSPKVEKLNTYQDLIF